ncbi:hypothetical protein [Pontibaca salina]|uniref:Uncharacterized protein n=1 Tax=Pontibaca salina TaxID=2795731 RepID=A0A934HWB5_9RHOB|nr:hypothetical protein [Pontibaca salina]MBI6630714.1 hypothetical protein [Pontibaca salina]
MQNETGTSKAEWHKSDTNCSALVPVKRGKSLSQLMKTNHKRMSRVLGFCLTLGTEDAWYEFSALAAVRLTELERAALAFAALYSLEYEHAEMTAAAVIGSAGDPPPSFLGGMVDARLWAEWANRSELKAYALAAYEAMSTQDQARFYQHISEVEIAA